MSKINTVCTPEAILEVMEDAAFTYRTLPGNSLEYVSKGLMKYQAERIVAVLKKEAPDEQD